MRRREHGGQAVQRPIVRSVERAARVMEALLARAPEGMRVSELSRELDLHKTTIVRLLHTLSAVGVVRKQQKNDLYTVDPLRWAGIVSNMRKLLSPADAVQRILEDLVAETGATAVVAFPDVQHRQMRIGAVSLSDDQVRVVPKRRQRGPMECTASGRAYLMSLTAEDLDAWKKAKPGGVTAESGISPEDLSARLEAARAHGYATAEDEFIPGTSSVAVPVRDENGRSCAALALTTAAKSLPERRIQQYAEALSRAAAALTRVLYAEGAVSADGLSPRPAPSSGRAEAAEEKEVSQRPYRVV